MPDFAILVLTLCSAKIAQASNWPNPETDPLMYIANPVEAEVPGHWIPLSVLKAILQKGTTAAPAAEHINVELNRPEKPSHEHKDKPKKHKKQHKKKSSENSKKKSDEDGPGEKTDVSDSAEKSSRSAESSKHEPDEKTTTQEDTSEEKPSTEKPSSEEPSEEKPSTEKPSSEEPESNEEPKDDPKPPQPPQPPRPPNPRDKKRLPNDHIDEPFL